MPYGSSTSGGFNGPSVPVFKPRKSAIEQNLIKLGEVNTVDLGPHVAFKDPRTGLLVIRKDHTVSTLGDLEELEQQYRFRHQMNHPALGKLLDYSIEEVLKLPMPDYSVKGYYSYNKTTLRFLKELRLEQKLPFREREAAVLAVQLVMNHNRDFSTGLPGRERGSAYGRALEPRHDRDGEPVQLAPQHAALAERQPQRAGLLRGSSAQLHGA